jgi:hypothetical protein
LQAAPDKEHLHLLLRSATDASATDASATDASATDASATDAAATDAAATDASATDAAATDASATDASATDASATDASATDASATDASATDASATDTQADTASAGTHATANAPARQRRLVRVHGGLQQLLCFRFPSIIGLPRDGRVEGVDLLQQFGVRLRTHRVLLDVRDPHRAFPQRPWCLAPLTEQFVPVLRVAVTEHAELFGLLLSAEKLRHLLSMTALSATESVMALSVMGATDLVIAC